jgi:hypothetical protein
LSPAEEVIDTGQAEFKLGYFGYFCALELIGTVKPEVCPPINGRMGKALRFLGFDVRAD